MRPSNLHLFLTSLMTLAAFGINAETRVYQWTDSKNVIHYSDTGPAGSRIVEVKAPSRGQVSATPAARPPDDEACQRKKSLLASYVSAGKVTETNALGETREYDDAQKAKLIKTTEAAVQEACGES